MFEFEINIHCTCSFVLFIYLYRFVERFMLHIKGVWKNRNYNVMSLPLEYTESQ